MSMEELQKKNDRDLTKSIEDTREELRSLRFSAAGSGMRDVKAIRNIKKEVARALTELNSRTRLPEQQSSRSGKSEVKQ